jgi:hypothetical protein
MVIKTFPINAPYKGYTEPWLGLEISCIWSSTYPSRISLNQKGGSSEQGVQVCNTLSPSRIRHAFFWNLARTEVFLTVYVAKSFHQGSN